MVPVEVSEVVFGAQAEALRIRGFLAGEALVPELILIVDADPDSPDR